MYNADHEILYIGKAKNLKDRVGTYFLASNVNPKVQALVAQIAEIEVTVANSETEALLLEVLSDWQVSVPEMGTVVARRIPLVFLTSNGTRDLSEALKRRCLYLHLDYPTVEREREIVLARVPDLPAHLAGEVARVVRSLRRLDLRKPPSVSETLDWARTLVVLGVDALDADVTESTLHVLLKHRADIATAARELKTAG